MGRGEEGAEADAVVGLFFGLDVADGVEAGDEVVAVVGDEKIVGVEGVGDEFEAVVHEGFEAFAGVGADEAGVGIEEAGAEELVFGGGVDFIEDGDDAFGVGVEFFEDGEGGGVVGGDVGGGDVEDVDEEVGDDGFFEGGFKGFDEAVGEAADEADGVGDEEFLSATEDELTGGGVEGGEEFVFGEDVGAGEGVEEGGFAGVGVADDGGGGDGDALAFVALDAALFADVAEFAFEAGDAVVDEAAVLFELGLAFAAHAALAALAGEVGPGAGEAGEGILHAGEGDLEDGFAGLGAVGEDIEDDLFAVDDGDFGEFFPVALLGGGEGVVEDDEVGFEFFGAGDDGVGFAGAEEGGGGGLAEGDEFAAYDADAEVGDEFVEFFEEVGAFAGGHLGGLDADEEGAFAAVGVGGSIVEEVGHREG